MEFVKEENLVMHHVTVLQQCAYDLSKVTGDRVRFAKILEDDLVWHLNDWALDDYNDFVATLMRCIDRYAQGKPIPTAEEIVTYTYNLAELISLETQAQAEADAKAIEEFYRAEAEADVREFCSNLGSKASEVLETAKATIPDKLRTLSTYGTAMAGWFINQLTQEFTPEDKQQTDGDDNATDSEKAE